MDKKNIFNGSPDNFDITKQSYSTLRFGNDMAKQTEKINKAMEGVHMQKIEDRALRKKSVELLERMVELGEQNPEAIQKIGTIINATSIENVQINNDNASGVQNINNNTGMSSEQFQSLLNSSKELFSLMKDETMSEANEMIDLVSEEAKSEKPKKGIMKASIKYLLGMVNSIILDPVTSIAKEQFNEYAQELASQILDGLTTIANNIGI